MTHLIPAIFENGHLTPIKPLHLPEHQKVYLAITIEEDDIPTLYLNKLAENSICYRFLNDPEEDIYSPSDGEDIT